MTALRRSIPICVGLCVLLGLALSASVASYPPVRGQQGMVAADAEVASAVGVQMLEAGGSAADAAIAATLVLGVVHPHSSGLGGGGFVLYYDRESAEVTVLDFRERAPAAAERDMFVVDGEVEMGRLMHSGLSIGVPGEIAGLWELHQRFGRLPWEQLFEPAIQLARDGFVVDAELASVLTSYPEMIAARPELAGILTTSEGTLVTRGDRLVRADLAATLERLAHEGPPAFYTGHVAEQIVASASAAGGMLTLDDLSGYSVIEREPISATYRGYTFYTMPPPSSGGITMLQILGVLEGFDLRSLGHNSSAYLHLLGEAMKFGFADRAVYLGDSDFVEVPTSRLLDPDLAARRRSAIDPEATLPSDAYGMEVAPPPDDSGTSHLSVVDAERSMVALTTTVNTGFGATVLAGDTGIVLNNEMADFSAQPGVPNPFGLIGAEANEIEPGKTPLSSMSPTLVMRDGQPYITLGGSGGPRIITATLQTLLNLIEFGMTVTEAVDAPRIHHQWMPETLFLEPQHPRDVVDNLSRRGHSVAQADSIAVVQAIVVDGDWLYGAADPRKGGVPRAY